MEFIRTLPMILFCFDMIFSCDNMKMLCLHCLPCLPCLLTCLF